MNAPDNLRQHVAQEIHWMRQKVAEVQSSIDTLELLLTEIKWIQEQEEIDVSK